MNKNRLSVKKAAELMGASELFVRRGLQQGLFPWGYAVKTSSRYTYWISLSEFIERTGINITGEISNTAHQKGEKTCNT